MLEPVPRGEPRVLARRRGTSRNRVQPLSERFSSSSVEMSFTRPAPFHASATSRPDSDWRKSFARFFQASARSIPASLRPTACGVTFKASVRGLESYGYEPEEAVFATTLTGHTAYCSLRDAVLVPLMELVEEDTADLTLRITGARVGLMEHSIMAPVLEFATEAGEDGMVAIWVTMTSEVLACRRARAPPLTSIEVSHPCGIGEGRADLASWRQGVQLASTVASPHTAAEPTLVVVMPPGLAPPGGA